MAPSDVFTAIANPTRRDVLALLRQGPSTAGALASQFEMRRPSLSEHLRVLREAGLVTVDRRGRQWIYHLDARPLQDVAGWLAAYEDFWGDRMADLGSLLDAEDDG